MLSKGPTRIGNARRIGLSQWSEKRASGIEGPGDSLKRDTFMPKRKAGLHVVCVSGSILAGSWGTLKLFGFGMKRCNVVDRVGKFHHCIRPAGEMFQSEIADDRLRRCRVNRVGNTSGTKTSVVNML